MKAAQTADTMSPGLLKVVERAKSNPSMRFNSLAHLLDEDALKRAYGRIRKDAAVGVDGITKEAYGKALDENIRSLHQSPTMACGHPQGMKRSRGVRRCFIIDATRAVGRHEYTRRRGDVVMEVAVRGNQGRRLNPRRTPRAGEGSRRSRS